MQKYALVTGGSSGIGLAISKLLAADGYGLLIVSKPAAELEQAKASLEASFPGLVVATLALDLSQRSSAEQVFDWAQQQPGAVEILVNNAGFGTYGFINDIDLEQDTAMLDLHVVTLYRLTRLFLKDMYSQNKGRILNLSSVSAFQPNPFLQTYGASKAFVYQFSRAIAFELKEKGSAVRVCTVCPPPVKNTAFQHAAGMDRTNTFDNWMVLTPQKVALDAYAGLKAGKTVVIPGPWYFSFLQKLIGLMPDALLIRMSRYYLQTR
jgi:uncharacterized protein